jgi:UDP-N-acetylmuramoyl-L-alanyl-D-glutamate--2,6-diaminopimelate ligase
MSLGQTTVEPVMAGALARVQRALVDAGQVVEVLGTLPAEITGLADDSRHVRPGGMFIAVRGVAADGHAYLDRAAAQGAAVAIVEAQRGSTLPALVVRDARTAAALAAAVAYDHPARALQLVGVTGTNGKTTTVGLLRHLLDAPDAPAASIGTLGVLVGSAGTALPGGGGLTTPGPVELQRLLRVLVDAGVRRVAMETSSHALHQGRVRGVAFAAALFTNLTRDHLDYHGSMEAYRDAKALLVGHLAADGVLVRNADESAWDALPAAPRRLTFGRRHPGADVRATDLQQGPAGSSWTLHTPTTSVPVTVPLLGDFNVDNALAAAAVAVGLGVTAERIAARLASVPQVPGRLERIATRPLVLRDYAHTPDALERALHAARASVPGGRLIVVFGCGGDRDPGKRPLMGAVAARLADQVIVTSDNPRTEDPERILDAIVDGLGGRPHQRIEDRRSAIAAALAAADPARDLVLLAGKGHETYQIRGTTTLPFDEARIVADLLGVTA